MSHGYPSPSHQKGLTITRRRRRRERLIGQYLTFENIGNAPGRINFKVNCYLEKSDIYTLFYRINGGEWVSQDFDIDINVQVNTDFPNVDINPGDIVEYKVEEMPYFIDDLGGSLYLQFLPNFSAKVSGNIHSIFCPDFATNYQGKFYALFSYSSVVDARDLILPAARYNSYGYMFQGCTGLTAAPELPATTLAEYCYSGMFHGCTSLTTAPELPATTLASNCYSNMFYGCTSLTAAPELPATTLVTKCYEQMFQGCTNLNYIKAMFTTEPSTTYTSNWVNGVASTGTFVKNASASWTTTGVNGVPTGWTVETTSE
jgi:hypothetical protein